MRFGRRLLLASAGALLVGGVSAARPHADAPPTGRYALQLRVASTARVRFVGTTQSLASSTLLVNLAPGPGGWTQSHQVCASQIDSGSPMAHLIVPRSFIESLPTRSYGADVGTRVGSPYLADLGEEAIGFDPALTGGKLPRHPAEPGVQDPDGDGEPGATLRLRMPRLGSARLFVVQRSHLVLRGRRISPNWIEGSVDIRLQEQHTLRADPGIFAQNPSVRPDPARSGFTLIRVPPDTGCDDLRDRGAHLFAQRTALPAPR